MTESRTSISEQLLTWIVVERRSPNEFLAVYFKENPNVLAHDALLSLQEAVLELEEMYSQVCDNEWNDWGRADQWLKFSKLRPFERHGSAGLLMLKAELYRCVSLMAFDAVSWDHQHGRSMTCGDLTVLWEARGSSYFQ